MRGLWNASAELADFVNFFIIYWLNPTRRLLRSRNVSGAGEKNSRPWNGDPISCFEGVQFDSAIFHKESRWRNKNRGISVCRRFPRGQSRIARFRAGTEARNARVPFRESPGRGRNHQRFVSHLDNHLSGRVKMRRKTTGWFGSDLYERYASVTLQHVFKRFCSCRVCHFDGYSCVCVSCMPLTYTNLSYIVKWLRWDNFRVAQIRTVPRAECVGASCIILDGSYPPKAE